MAKHTYTYFTGVIAVDWYAQNLPLAQSDGDVWCRGGPGDFIESQ